MFHMRTKCIIQPIVITVPFLPLLKRLGSGRECARQVGTVRPITRLLIKAGGSALPRPRKPDGPFAAHLVARCDPAGGDDVRSLSVVAAQCRRLLFERGIDICHETVRMWWYGFGPMFTGAIRGQRVSRMRGFEHWRWHLDEKYLRLNVEMVYLWRAVDHKGEILRSYIAKTLKRRGLQEEIATDGQRFTEPR